MLVTTSSASACNLKTPLSECAPYRKNILSIPQGNVKRYRTLNLRCARHLCILDTDFFERGYVDGRVDTTSSW